MTSYAMPRWDGAILCRLTLLELVESELGCEEWVEGLSRWEAILDLYADSSFSMYLEPLRYVGVKNP